jgi:hypothetical protein
LAPEDRCHLNGLAVHRGRPRFVSAHSETDTPAGWRPDKISSGCVIEVASGNTVARNLSMPHSPRVYAGKLWVLNSGRGHLLAIDPSTGRGDVVSRQPGYTRGLSFADHFAFVGLSKIRETSTFGGMPIAEQRDSLKCGVGIVDLRKGGLVAHLEFQTGVEEIFDVQVLRGARHPYFSGPFTHAEGRSPIWVVPASEVDRSRSPSQASKQNDGGAAPGVSPPPPSKIPPTALAHYRRGNHWFEQGAYAESAACFEESVRLSPDFVEALCNLGATRQFQGNLRQSADLLRTAIRLRPEMPAAHFNLAMTSFLMSDLETGWTEYEWRWKCANFGSRPAGAAELAPAWCGESLNNKTLLIYGEQGVGDEIMFASCVPDVMASARHLFLACEVRLAPLFARSFPHATVIPVDVLAYPLERAKLASIDCQVAAGSVPGLLRYRTDRIPPPNGFLRVEVESCDTWKHQLAQLGKGLKVGISWRGGKDAAEQQRRSTTLDQWLPLLSSSGCQFVNLQHGESRVDLIDIETRAGIHISHFPDIDPIVDLDKFASLISALDLVVTIDNSTMHLAAALGVPTWGLLAFPSASYWRWFGEGTQSVWYDSLTLIRKASTTPWDQLISELAGRLQQHVASM